MNLGKCISIAAGFLVMVLAACGSGDGAADTSMEQGPPHQEMEEVSESLAGADIVELGNAICPVMGEPVAEGLFVDWNGYRINICCPGCDGILREDPRQYIEKLASDESIPEDLRGELLSSCPGASGSGGSDSGSCGGCH